MIRFRVFALPRSGSSWVSTWLNGGRVPCYHDPIEYCRTMDAFEELGKRGDCGICCTGAWLLDGWDQSIPTIMLERDIEEVQRSLVRIGLPQIQDHLIDRWASLEWPRFTLAELQGPAARDVWRHVRPWDVFPQQKHNELCKLKIEPTDREIARVLAEVNSLKEVA